MNSRELHKEYMKSVATTNIIMEQKKRKPSLFRALYAVFVISLSIAIPVFIFVGGISMIISLFF